MLVNILEIGENVKKIFSYKELQNLENLQKWNLKVFTETL